MMIAKGFILEPAKKQTEKPVVCLNSLGGYQIVSTWKIIDKIGMLLEPTSKCFQHKGFVAV